MKSLEGLFRHLEEHEREQAEAKAKAKIEAQAQAKVVVRNSRCQEGQSFWRWTHPTHRKVTRTHGGDNYSIQTEGEKSGKRSKLRT